MVALSHLFTYFNSRPHGGRLLSRKLALGPHYFNSRPHGGRHPRHLFRDRVTFISTHALTEGDETGVHDNFISDISTHALTEGDYYLKSAIRRASHFNSRPHGGRPITSGFLKERRYFNSRPHGGRRQI